MVKITAKRPGTAPESFHTNEFFGTVPRLPVPRLPPGGSLGTPKILGTGATLRLGPISLHDQNWECRASKSSARCQKFGVPCRSFSACKWGLKQAPQRKIRNLFFLFPGLWASCYFVSRESRLLNSKDSMAAYFEQFKSLEIKHIRPVR